MTLTTRTGPRGEAQDPHVWQLRVYGQPVPQGRPRAFVTKSGHASVYDPSASREWKAVVRAQVIAAKPWAPYEGPVELTLEFILPRPGSLPKKVKHHTKRPDVDNLGKAVKDALKGLVYRDDSQVCKEHITKGYGEQPGVMVWAAALEGGFVMGENVAVTPQEIPF